VLSQEWGKIRLSPCSHPICAQIEQHIAQITVNFLVVGV
jgi:hypothetical protein